VALHGLHLEARGAAGAVAAWRRHVRVGVARAAAARRGGAIGQRELTRLTC